MEEGGARSAALWSQNTKELGWHFPDSLVFPLISARWLPKGQTSHLHTTASQQRRRGGIRRAFSHATSFFVIMRKIFSRGSQQSSSYVLLAELSQWQGEESGYNWTRTIKSISWDFKKKIGVLISKGKWEKSAVLGGQRFLYIVFKPRLPSLPHSPLPFSSPPFIALPLDPALASQSPHYLTHMPCSGPLAHFFSWSSLCLPYLSPIPLPMNILFYNKR